MIYMIHVNPKEGDYFTIVASYLVQLTSFLMTVYFIVAGALQVRLNYLWCRQVAHVKEVNETQDV